MLPCDKVSASGYCHKGKQCLRGGTQSLPACFAQASHVPADAVIHIAGASESALKKLLSVGKDTHGSSTVEALLEPHAD